MNPLSIVSRTSELLHSISAVKEKAIASMHEVSSRCAETTSFFFHELTHCQNPGRQVVRLLAYSGGVVLASTLPTLAGIVTGEWAVHIACNKIFPQKMSTREWEEMDVIPYTVLSCATGCFLLSSIARGEGWSPAFRIVGKATGLSIIVGIFSATIARM